MLKNNFPAGETEGALTFAGFIKNIGICFGLTVIFFAVFAVAVTYLPIPEGIVPVVVLLITIASTALSGFLTARNVHSRGWLCGAVTGCVYMVTLFLLGSLVFQSFNLGADFFTMLFIGILSGAFGGIAGVNI